MKVYYLKFKNSNSGKTVVSFFSSHRNMYAEYLKIKRMHPKTKFYEGITELNFSSFHGVTIAGKNLSFPKLVRYGKPKLLNSKK